MKWNCYILICFSPIKFTFKNAFLFYVAKARFMRNPGVPVAVYTNFYITVQFEKIDDWHS